jgi:hypothetical protein
MAKYAQTLTANGYNDIDFSNRLKEAMDNMGWGTGKVDILGGYRFTATDQANSITTPLVVNGADFLENHSGKNIIRPIASGSVHRPTQILSMYLPGVRQFRLRYTVMSPTLANGTVVTINDAANRMDAVFCKPNITVYTTTTYGNSDHHTLVQRLNPASFTVGTQYTTAWVGNLNIIGIIGVTFRFNKDIYIVIDAVEYTVDQNKFAWQSPNLDSPTFESYTVTHAGNLYSVLTTLPIKTSKTPVVKISPFYFSTSASQHDTSSYDYYNEHQALGFAYKVLFDNETPRNERGWFATAFNTDVIAYGSYGKDISINAGSNNTFDGFYLNTRQDTVWNGTVWDTVNKSSAFPNTSPQFPSQRKTVTTALGGIHDSIMELGASILYEGCKSYEVFRVKNQTSIQGFQYRFNGRGSSSPYNPTIPAVLYRVEQDAGTKKFVVREKLADLDFSATGVHSSFWRTATLDTTLQPGIYALAIKSSNQPIQTASRILSPGAFMTPPASGRNIDFLISSPIAEANTPPFRYIRDTVYGSSVNTGTQWVEIEAYNREGVNVALNKPVTSTGNATNVARVTDGTKTTSTWYEGGVGPVTVTVDLGSTTKVDSIVVSHYRADNRSYTSKLETSVDGTTWTEIFNGTYQETSSGRTHDLRFSDIQLIPNQTTIGPGNDSAAYSLSGNPVTEKVCIIETGTATPVSVIGSFAENWANFGWIHTPPQSPRVNKLTAAQSAIRIGHPNYKSVKYTNFTFGVDQQMLWQAGNDYLVTPQPGAVFTANTLEGMNRNTNSVVEFFGTFPNFTDRKQYVRNKVSSLEGTTYEFNNTFIVYGTSTTLNTSYVTLDGTEYVFVMDNLNDANTGSGVLAFELRP